jgi:hypothetical protein
MFHWAGWNYTYWNKELIDRWLYVSDGDELLSIPIDRIPATPEELSLLVGAQAGEATAVADAFIAQVKLELPPGRSFCGFCDYGPWTPVCSYAPHFFGMLWFTCLVAYGYPAVDGSFDERIVAVLGRSHNYQCLPQLWQDLAKWIQGRRAVGESVRELVLPPTSEHRRIIGHSHFLAFPNRRDRRTLATLLTEYGLVGFEPPLVPVVKALAAARKGFSKDFLEDLDDFQTRFARGEDPRDNAFWRAVRREALAPSTNTGRGSGVLSNRTALLFLEDEQALRPIVGCHLDAELPEGFELHRSEELFPWPAYITGPDSDLQSAWLEAFGAGHIVPLGTRKLIAQGVLILKESSGGQYDVVAGPDIHGCSRALVSSALIEHFVNTFPGRTGVPRVQSAVIGGWFEVDGCEIRQLDEPPAGLLGVTQLLRTMQPPSVSYVGGLKTTDGFLFVPGFLPTIRLPGALSVEVVETGDDSVHPCVESADRPGDWNIPATLKRHGTLTVRAAWAMPIAGGSVNRTAHSSLVLVADLIQDDYRGKPSGHYFVESSSEPESDVASCREVPLGMSTLDSERSADLLEFDASARFLGPGLGQMALQPTPGFDWLVVGAKKNPELLVFVGNEKNPTQPVQARSSSKGGQRHWRRGFEARRKLVRLLDGRFVGLPDAPTTVRQAYSLYKRHRVETDVECPTASIDTHREEDVAGTLTDSTTWRAADVIATLASRRSRLTYPEVRDALKATLGRDDPIELQQILRGWAECGAIDLLRSARVSRFAIVPRSPRFVLVRRGAEVEATLVGLTTSVRRRQIDRVVSRCAPTFTRELLPPTGLQPSTLRIRCDEHIVEAIRREASLPESEWLDWPRGSAFPPALDVSAARDALLRTDPPDSYRFDADWDWSEGSFYRGRRDTDELSLERRAHADASVIYVLTRRDEVLLWTHSRTWALLEAYAIRGIAPFAHRCGLLTSRGRAPVHLPLPLGRLCVVIGQALPGPTLGSGQMRYHYPFGQRLFGLAERVIPPDWYVSDA